jgi:hypothetical protein
MSAPSASPTRVSRFSWRCPWVEPAISSGRQTSTGPSTRLVELLVLALSLAVVTAGCGSSSELGRSSLATQAQAVRSLAAEGALLAGDTAAGRTTGAYRREHASELATAASSATRSLAAARTTRALAQKLHALHAIAWHVASQLERLGHASNDDARTLERELQAGADASAKLDEALA